METDVVVWNLDARYRPELEVDLEIVRVADDIPGEHFALRRIELEVEIVLPFDDDAWFVADDAIVDDWVA